DQLTADTKEGVVTNGSGPDTLSGGGNGMSTSGGATPPSPGPRGAPSPAADPTTPGPTGVTGTNNQVTDVDGADIVKNDGTRIFVLSGGRLFATTSWPPTNLALASALTIEGTPRELLLTPDNKAVVLSGVYVAYPDSTGSAPGGSGGGSTPPST